ncbi:hypothetical protein V8C43DRAFT_276687 [Trichoderma afarasin]
MGGGLMQIAGKYRSGVARLWPRQPHYLLLWKLIIHGGRHSASLVVWSFGVRGPARANPLMDAESGSSGQGLLVESLKLTLCLNPLKFYLLMAMGS